MNVGFHWIYQNRLQQDAKKTEQLSDEFKKKLIYNVKEHFSKQKEIIDSNLQKANENRKESEIILEKARIKLKEASTTNQNKPGTQVQVVEKIKLVEGKKQNILDYDFKTSSNSIPKEQPKYSFETSRFPDKNTGRIPFRLLKMDILKNT